MNSGITIHTGTEGPRHDPYSYTEITVRLPRKAPVTIHYGLGEWLRIGNDAQHDIHGYSDQVLRTLTGYSITQAERIVRKAREADYRLHKAHGGYHWSSGFPGESLCFCRCGNVIDSTFDEGAII